MADYSNSRLDDQGSPLVIKSCILGSPRSTATIDITSCVGDFEIYEHIDKPYLTGNISFADFDNIISTIRFGGDEHIELTISKPGESNDITKKFHLDKIRHSGKANQNTEVYFFHMTQDTDYESNLVDVNKYYEGKALDIIKNILSDYTNLTLNNYDTFNNIDSKNKFKVIIPHMNPMEAITWIKDKAQTSNGLPFLLFQTLKDDGLNVIDLETMLNNNIVNKNIPFVDWESVSQSDRSFKSHQIISANFSNTENLYKYINEGYVGANYQIYDMKRGIPTNVHLDIEKTFEKLKNSGVLKQNLFDFVFPVGSNYNGQNISTLGSRFKQMNSIIGSYNQGYSNYNSYNEEVSKADYLKEIEGKAIKNILLKSAMTVTIHGQHLLESKNNFTIGNKMRFLFLKNSEINSTDPTQLLDQRKSGDYLVLAASHSFTKPSNYNVTLYCSKLENVDSQLERLV